MAIFQALLLASSLGWCGLVMGMPQGAPGLNTTTSTTTLIAPFPHTESSYESLQVPQTTSSAGETFFSPRVESTQTGLDSPSTKTTPIPPVYSPQTEHSQSSLDAPSPSSSGQIFSIFPGTAHLESPDGPLQGPAGTTSSKPPDASPEIAVTQTYLDVPGGTTPTIALPMPVTAVSQTGLQGPGQTGVHVAQPGGSGSNPGSGGSNSGASPNNGGGEVPQQVTDASGSPHYMIAGSTLDPGPSALTVSGTTYSIPATGGPLYVNGNPSIQYATAAPHYVIAGSTLAPGSSALVVSETTYSIPASGGPIYINGSPQPQYPTAYPKYVISGSTITPGASPVVISGTTYSVPAAGGPLYQGSGGSMTTAAIPTNTNEGNLGEIILSAIGVTSPASTSGTTRSRGQEAQRTSTATSTNSPAATQSANAASRETSKDILAEVVILLGFCASVIVM